MTSTISGADGFDSGIAARSWSGDLGPAGTTERAADIEYTNTTNFEKEVSIIVISSSGGDGTLSAVVYVDGGVLLQYKLNVQTGSTDRACFNFTVPKDVTYSIGSLGSANTITLWRELS